MSYQQAIEFLDSINKEDICAVSPMWEQYKKAIEIKVEYEIKLKEKK